MSQNGGDLEEWFIHSSMMSLIQIVEKNCADMAARTFAYWGHFESENPFYFYMRRQSEIATNYDLAIALMRRQVELAAEDHQYMQWLCRLRDAFLDVEDYFGEVTDLLESIRADPDRPHVERIVANDALAAIGQRWEPIRTCFQFVSGEMEELRRFFINRDGLAPPGFGAPIVRDEHLSMVGFYDQDVNDAVDAHQHGDAHVVPVLPEVANPDHDDYESHDQIVPDGKDFS